MAPFFSWRQRCRVVAFIIYLLSLFSPSSIQHGAMDSLRANYRYTNLRVGELVDGVLSGSMGIYFVLCVCLSSICSLA